jgi:hypothetical protein
MIPAMAERDPEGTERDVLSSLPRTRPTRRSSKRDAPAGKATKQKAAPARPRPPATAARRARPATAATPAVPPAGYATPRTERPEHHHGLVGTAVQAVGEVAELGLAVGAQALKGALGRLPRP